MPAIVSQDPCTICSVNESIMHSHHTIPRSRGGEDSRQIILCSSCHNILHANALYVVSRVRNPKRQARLASFWPTDKEERRAAPWLEILVQALLAPVEHPELVGHPVGLSLDEEEFRLFKLLAKDLGCSQENALRYCIHKVLETRGLKNGKKQVQSQLWFMPVPGKRTDV